MFQHLIKAVAQELLSTSVFCAFVFSVKLGVLVYIQYMIGHKVSMSLLARSRVFHSKNFIYSDYWNIKKDNKVLKHVHSKAQMNGPP